MRTVSAYLAASLLVLGGPLDAALAFDASKVPSPNDGRMGVDRLTIQGSGSTGDVSTMSATPIGATRARTLASKLTDSGVSVLDFGPNVGAGGDDSAAINAAIAAAVNNPAKAGNVLFPTPPSGFYNVCASPVEIPGLGANLHLRGSVGSGAKVRLMPGCTSGITSVLHQTSNTAQSSRVRIDNMVFDGRCGTKYAANIEYAVGWTATNTIFRNAKKGGTTVLLGGGYEFSVGDGNRIENVNDADNGNCYKTTDDMPDYGLRTRSTDSYFTGLIVINARIATVFNENGGGNNYTGTHVWGYVTNAFNQGGPDMRPQYGYLINGAVNITSAITDNFTVAGYYFRNDQHGSKAKIIGSNCIGTNVSGAACILLGDAINSITVLGNNVQGVHDARVNGIRREGTIAGATQIRDNAGTDFSTPFNLTNVVGGDNLRLEAYGAGAGTVISSQSPTPNSSLYLVAKGTAPVIVEAPLAVRGASGGDNVRTEGYGSGSGGLISSQSAAANSPLFLAAKGTSPVTSRSPLEISSTAGGDTLRMESFAAGEGTGIYPYSPSALSSLHLSDKGGGSVILQSNGAQALVVNNPANAANRFQITGNTPGFAPTFSAAGSDANIAATVIGKGTSGINLGAYTAQAADPTTGQIPAGRCADWHNSTANTFKRWCNFGGTLRSLSYN